MDLVLEIAWTHVTARFRQSVVAVLGVTTGVALTVLLSALIAGQEKDMVSKLVDSMPHVAISDERQAVPGQPAEVLYGAAQSSNKPIGTERRTGIRNPNEVIAALRAWLPGAIALSVKATGMLSHGTQRLGVTFIGIDPLQEEAVSKLAAQMRIGQLSNLSRGSNAAVIGEGLAKKTGATVGTSVTLSGSEGVSISASVVGIFRFGIQALDESQVYTSIRTAQVLAGRPGMINEMRARLDDAQSAREVARRIETQIGYRAVPWQEANADILSALATTKMIGYMVIAAMLFGATLGIYSIISTITNEKRSDIAIMKSFGMREGRVRSIFIVESAIIGTVGALVGWLLGWLLCRGAGKITVANVMTGEHMNIPVYHTIGQYLAIATITLVACCSAGFFPARKASRVPPVDIIRGAT